MQSVELKPDLCNPQLLVVIMVVLTEIQFRFSLIISQLLAKAIPVRGAKFRKSRLGKLSGIFAFLSLSYSPRLSTSSLSGSTAPFLSLPFPDPTRPDPTRPK